jgi:hypothetical protein
MTAIWASRGQVALVEALIFTVSLLEAKTRQLIGRMFRRCSAASALYQRPGDSKGGRVRPVACHLPSVGGDDSSFYRPHLAGILTNLGALYGSMHRFDEGRPPYCEAARYLTGTVKEDPAANLLEREYLQASYKIYLATNRLADPKAAMHR